MTVDEVQAIWRGWFERDFISVFDGEYRFVTDERFPAKKAVAIALVRRITAAHGRDVQQATVALVISELEIKRNNDAALRDLALNRYDRACAVLRRIWRDRFPDAVTARETAAA